MRAAALLVFVGGCAWQDGVPMGTIDVELDARWEALADRDVGSGWQRLASGFEVQVDVAEATLGDLALVDVGGGAAAFDPANPPPGYSLCHGGHCHADDGRLVPYEEIAAELGLDAAAPVRTFPVGAWNLLDGAPRALGCGGPCDLPRASIGRVELEVDALRLAGLVRDTVTPPRIEGTAPWTIVLATPMTMSGATDLPVDRAHDPAIALVVEVRATTRVLDDIPFDDLASPATAEALAEALAATEIVVAAERTDL